MCKPIYSWTTGTGLPVEAYIEIKDCPGGVVFVKIWRRDEAGQARAVEFVIKGRIDEVRAT